MAFVLPAGSVLQGNTNGGDTLTWQLPGHSVQKPKLAIVRRTTPTFDHKLQKWSTPKFGYKVVVGIADADGNPISPYITVGTDGISYPMGGVGRAAAVEEALTLFKGLTSGLGADDILSQRFPVPAV
nr:MAG: hypothetical protein [Eriocheir sinensis solspivirus 1]